MKKNFLMVVCVISICIFIVLSSSGQSFSANTKPEIELKFAYHSTPVHALSIKGHEVWAREVEEVTNGRVKVITYPGETLCKGKDTWSAVKGGLADVGWAFEGLFPGQFPLTNVVTLPCMFPSGNASTITEVLMELYNRFPEIQEEYKDVKLLYFNVQTPTFIGTSKKPVRKLEDLKGLKLRAAGTWLPQFLRQNGAIPIAMGPADIYESLQRGIIDGYVYTGDGALARNLHEVTKYATDARLDTAPFFTIMNIDVWNKMPEEIKIAIEKVSGIKGALRLAHVMDEEEIRWWNKCKETGIENFDLLPAERERWQNTAKPLWETWMAEMEGQGKKRAQQIVKEALDIFHEKIN